MRGQTSSIMKHFGLGSGMIFEGTAGVCVIKFQFALMTG